MKQYTNVLDPFILEWNKASYKTTVYVRNYFRY